MKKIAAIAVIGVTVFLVAWLGMRANRLLADRKAAEIRRQVLPDITLPDIHGRSHALSANDSTASVLVFFTTTCEYCRRELAALRMQRDAFVGTHVFLISPEDAERLDSFSFAAGLAGIDGFHIVRDTVLTLARSFRIDQVPTTMVYDAHGQLQSVFEGLTPVSVIVSAVRGEP